MYRFDYKVIKFKSKSWTGTVRYIMACIWPLFAFAPVRFYFQPKLALAFLLHSSALTFSLTLWSCETQFTVTAEIILPRHALSAILTYQVLAATFFHLFEHSCEILLLREPQVQRPLAQVFVFGFDIPDAPFEAVSRTSPLKAKQRKLTRFIGFFVKSSWTWKKVRKSESAM